MQQMRNLRVQIPLISTLSLVKITYHFQKGKVAHGNIVIVDFEIFPPCRLIGSDH